LFTIVNLWHCSTARLSDLQIADLRACWNVVYSKLFGFKRHESTRCSFAGLGRLDCEHLRIVTSLKFVRNFVVLAVGCRIIVQFQQIVLQCNQKMYV